MSPRGRKLSQRARKDLRNERKRKRRLSRHNDETLLSTAMDCLCALNRGAFQGAVVDVEIAVRVPAAEKHVIGHGLAKSTVPAAQFDQRTMTISLHPHLARVLAPRFVIQYLVHGCLIRRALAVLGVAPADIEQAAWARELAISRRKDAIKWLATRAYPTLPIEPPGSIEVTPPRAEAPLR